MLLNFKEARGKYRHLRSKDTMAANRKRMPFSFDVVRELRSRRESLELKRYFVSFPDAAKHLNMSLYLELRNYLLVEILLANVQRSGIIEGMLIMEVLQDKGNRNNDNLPYLYVANQKTGYLQPTKLYLDAEIYD